MKCKEDGEEFIFKGLFDSLVFYDSLNKWDLTSSYFLPQTFKIDITGDISNLTCFEQKFQKEQRILGKFELKFDILLQKSQTREINIIDNTIRDTILLNKKTMFQQIDNIQKLIPYFLIQKTIDKQYTHKQKLITLVLKVYSTHKPHLITMIDNFFYYYDDEQQSQENQIIADGKDLKDIFDSETLKNMTVHAKAIATYCMLALYESKNMENNQDKFPRNYYFNFKLDQWNHLYLIDLFMDGINHPNSNISITADTALLFVRKEKKQEEKDLIYLENIPFGQILPQFQGTYYKQFNTLNVYIPKNDLLLKSYFDEREDWIQIENKECAYAHADAIFSRNMNLNRVKLGKILFDQPPALFSLWTNMEKLQTLLQDNDKLHSFEFKSSDFIPVSRVFDCRDRAWESTQQVDFITDDNNTQETSQWILKTSITKKIQVFPKFKDLVKTLRLYKGKLIENVTVQQFIENPLLSRNRYIDFKVFMIVVSTHPLIVLYKDGFARINSINYDQNNINSIKCDRSSHDSIQNCEFFHFKKIKELLQQEYDISDQKFNRIIDRFKAALSFIVIGSKYKIPATKNYVTILECTFIVDMTMNVHLINIKQNYQPKQQVKIQKHIYQELIEYYLDLSLILYKKNFNWQKKYKEYCRNCTIIFNENQVFEYVHYLRTYDNSLFKATKKDLQKKLNEEF